MQKKREKLSRQKAICGNQDKKKTMFYSSGEDEKRERQLEFQDQMCGRKTICAQKRRLCNGLIYRNYPQMRRTFCAKKRWLQKVGCVKKGTLFSRFRASTFWKNLHVKRNCGVFFGGERRKKKGANVHCSFICEFTVKMEKQNCNWNRQVHRNHCRALRKDEEEL